VIIIYLRNLLECSALVTLIAELDLITRVSEILSGQPPSSRPPLMSSDPLITLLQGRCRCLQIPSRHSQHPGLPTVLSLRADQIPECFGTCHQHYPHGPNSPITTTHLTHDQPCPCSDHCSISNTHTSPSYQPSFPSPSCSI